MSNKTKVNKFSQLFLCFPRREKTSKTFPETGCILGDQALGREGLRPPSNADFDRPGP